MVGTLKVSVSASDDRSISSTSLLVDGRRIVTQAGAASVLYWDTSTAAKGPHTLVVHCTDGAGNVGWSAPVSIKVGRPAIYAASVRSGAPPYVRVIEGVTNSIKFTITPYVTSFTGGVQVALADLNCDGVPDIVTAPGRGMAPQVRVFDGRTGQPFLGYLRGFLAYGSTVQNGIWVACGDVNEDGHVEVITGPASALAPQLRVHNLWNGGDFYFGFAFSTGYTGGINVAGGH